MTILKYLLVLLAVSAFTALGKQFVEDVYGVWLMGSDPVGIVLYHIVLVVAGAILATSVLYLEGKIRG